MAHIHLWAITYDDKTYSCDDPSESYNFTNSKDRKEEIKQDLKGGEKSYSLGPLERKREVQKENTYPC